jgi:hypothetical protein
MFLLNGQRITLDSDLIIGTGSSAITHPAANLKNASLQAELGITEVPDPVRPDERRFFVTEHEDGTFTTTPRPIEQMTQPMWERIQAQRDAISAGGVQIGGHWFHTDLDSRIRYVGLLRITDAMKAMGAIGTDTVVNPATNATVLWKIMDGSRIPLTLNMVDAIFAAVTLLDMSAFESAELHRAAMEAMENPFDYDLSGGWPVTYTDLVP